MTPDKVLVTAEVVEVPKPERPDLWIAIKQKHDYPGWLSSHPYEDKTDADGYFGEPTIFIRVPGTQPQPAAPEADAVAAKNRTAKLEIAFRAMRMVLVDAAQYEEHQVIKSPWLGQMQRAIKETEGLV